MKGIVKRSYESLQDILKKRRHRITERKDIERIRAYLSESLHMEYIARRNWVSEFDSHIKVPVKKITDIDYVKSVLRFFQSRYNDGTFLNYIIPIYSYGFVDQGTSDILLGWLELECHEPDSEARSGWLPKSNLLLEENEKSLNMLHYENMKDTPITFCYIPIHEGDIDLYKLMSLMKKSELNRTVTKYDRLFITNYDPSVRIYPILI